MQLTTLPLATLDTLAASLRRIEALAGLLGVLSERGPLEAMDGKVVGEAAGMISDETNRLRAALGLPLSAGPRRQAARHPNPQ